ncbi:MAG: hypothetical protein RJA70_1013, partial [Pseudomonadota bacterium]
MAEAAGAEAEAEAEAEAAGASAEFDRKLVTEAGTRAFVRSKHHQREGKTSMNTENARLYEQIMSFQLDDPGTQLTFTQRLARENGWTDGFANRVVLEYKRFVFLAMVSNRPVTPSDQVDQAWHLHLTYTRSYWDKLCGQVLGRPLHHGPTQGGPAEGRKFRDWYEYTKDCYSAYFGEDAPSDIWPSSDVRFGDDLHFQRVKLKRTLVTARGSQGPDESTDVVLDELNLHPYDVAYLAGGAARAANTAIASLVDRGFLGCVPEKHQIMKVGTLGDECHPLELALFQGADLEPGTSVRALHSSASASLHAIRDRLRDEGLLKVEPPPGVSTVLGVLGCCISGFIWTSDGDVGTRRLFAVAVAVVSIVFFLRSSHFRPTARGESALAQARAALPPTAAVGTEGMTREEAQMAVGVLGVAAFSSGIFLELNQTLVPPSISAEGGGGCGTGGGGGGGDGGGCGGGGDGGGC